MLIKLLKRTWFFKKIEKIKNFFWVTLERIEARQTAHDAAIARIEQRQQAQDAVLASLSANDTSTLEALVHLVQREPADNALAESRQAALLREVRERSDATDEQVTALERRLERLAGRDEQKTLSRRLDELEIMIASRHEALERTLAAAREGVVMHSDLDALRDRLDELRGELAVRHQALERAIANGREAIVMRSDVDALRGRLDELKGELAVRHDALERALAAGREGVVMHSDLDALRDRFDESERTLAARYEVLERAVVAAREGAASRTDIDTLAKRLQEQVDGKPGHEDIRYGGKDEPELGLIAHLAPLLPRRVAIDIGANVGKYAEALLDAGFEVHAFEPNPPVLEQLRKRLGARKSFTAHGLALGARDGKLPLHLVRDLSPERYYEDVSLLSTLTTHALPDALVYNGKVDVPVRTLDGLHREGLVPAKVGYVKVDTEGFDLEVVRGMGSREYPLVSVEFWDKRMDFGRSGALNGLSDLVAELRGRGYRWWLVLYRVHPDPDEIVRFYCNVAKSVERSWGNAFFFRDHALFAEAERWCATVLPRTYFAATRARDGVPLPLQANG